MAKPWLQEFYSILVDLALYWAGIPLSLRENAVSDALQVVERLVEEDRHFRLS